MKDELFHFEKHIFHNSLVLIMSFRTFLSLIILFCFTKILFGQDDYQKWLKEQNKEYSQFISEQDKEFIEFLKKNWKSVDVQEGLKQFSKPKNPEPLIYAPSEMSTKPVELPSKEKPLNKTVNPGLKHEGNNEKKPASNDFLKNDQNNINLNNNTGIETESTEKAFIYKINFFDSELPVIYDGILDVSIKYPISKESVAEYWKRMSESNYTKSLNGILATRDKMRLNDWGYCKLLFDIGKQLTQNKRNESYLFTWFMLLKSGYIVRIGYEQNKIYLLVSTENRLFNVPYFRFNDQEDKFYVILLDSKEKEPEGEIYTYQGNYPQLSHKVSFSFKYVPDLGNVEIKKEINFNYMGKKYSVPVEYNKNLIDFYRDYPYTDLSVYFHSEISREAKKTLLNNLKLLIDSLKEKNAVNFLLHFVQDATGYETDKEQFGREKPFFPEESLYYPYSDCEDRAVFFAYLVRNLLGLKVVGLDYPDHVSTAVKFNTNVTGDYINYNNQKYIICDPTYLGASIGKSMPKYLNVTANIIN